MGGGFAALELGLRPLTAFAFAFGWGGCEIGPGVVLPAVSRLLTPFMVVLLARLRCLGCRRVQGKQRFRKPIVVRCVGQTRKIFAPRR